MIRGNIPLARHVGNNSEEGKMGVCTDGSASTSTARAAGVEADMRTRELEAANAALREESARLALTLDASQAGTWSWDVGSETVEWDNRVRELYGFEGDGPVSFDDYVSRVHQEDRHDLLNQLHRINRPGMADFWNHEFRILHPVLGERWIAGLGRIERDAMGTARRLIGINFDISKRKRIERSLRESEEKYRKLYESMMDAFVSVDMSGRIIESNSSYQKMLGYTSEELDGLTYIDVTPEKWHEFEGRLVTEQILLHGYSDLYEKEYRRKDGTVFPVELRTFLIRDAFGQPSAMWAIVRDITARRQTEQTMREWNQILERRVAERTTELNLSEGRFRQLAEATFEGIATSEGGLLVDGNPQLADLTGYALAEMIGRPMEDFVAPESRALVAGCLRANNEATYEFLGLRKDGSTFQAEAHTCTRTWQGRRTRCTALRDLTDLKQADAKLRAQQTALENAQRLALVSEVSAGIIHQIGQPLCAMGANLSAAVYRIGTCEAPRCGALEIIRDVDADVGRMREAVVHLRALANPEIPDRLPVNLNDLVAGVLKLLHHEAECRQVGIEVGFCDDLPPVPADAVQMGQVVLNLIHNAFDSCAGCPPDRRSVNIKTCPARGGGVEIRVRDSGAGITAEAMKRLFAPFFSTKQDGLGMGLRLCQTIVQAHGGTIEGGNNPDGPGATFRVFLPADLR
jgi:PAS domain S-box-containing protein